MAASWQLPPFFQKYLASPIPACAQQLAKIAVVLTDMSMPFMDGSATIRAVRKLNPSQNIIAMSGLMTNEQLANLQNLNVNAILSKPFTAEDLLTKLAEILQVK